MIEPLFFLNRESYGIYNRQMVTITGSLNTACFLSELVEKRQYHRNRGELITHPEYGEELFYQTIQGIEERLGLTKDEQATCVKKLVKLGFITVNVFGVPARRYFKLNDEAILQAYTDRMAESSLRKTRNKFAENPKLDGDIPENWNAENPQTIYKEEDTQYKKPKEDIFKEKKTGEDFKRKDLKAYREHVFLTEEEYLKLKELYGDWLDRGLDKVEYQKAVNGSKYKNDYMVFKQGGWVHDIFLQEKKTPSSSTEVPDWKIVNENKDFFMECKRDNPEVEILQTMYCTGNWLVIPDTGKELSLKMEPSAFKNAFLSLIGMVPDET